MKAGHGRKPNHAEPNPVAAVTRSSHDAPSDAEPVDVVDPLRDPALLHERQAGSNHDGEAIPSGIQPTDPNSDVDHGSREKPVK